MISGKYLLDTNYVIRLMAGRKLIDERLSSDPDLYLSIIVLGELYYGAQKSKRLSENMIQISDIMQSMQVLPCDEKTAYEYGIIKNDLHLKGRPIPSNDIWLAALARQHGLILVTRDRHFQEIEHLSIKQW